MAAAAAPAAAAAGGGAARRGAAASAAAQSEADGPPDIEVTLRALLAEPGVSGYFITNDAGIPIKWSSTGFSENPAGSGVIIPAEVTHFAGLMQDLLIKCQDSCDRLFLSDKGADRDETRLRYLRLHTEKQEIVVAPAEACTLVVLHKTIDPSAAAAAGGQAEEAEEA